MITRIEGLLIEDREQHTEVRLYEKSGILNLDLEWIILELRDDISQDSWTETKMMLSAQEAEAIRDYLTNLLDKDKYNYRS